MTRGTGKRLSIGAQVALSAALAVFAAGMLTWLSERPGMRWRVDLTSGGFNTLEPPTMTVIDSLPDGETIDVDVFFRPVEMPLTELAAEAQARFFKMLVLANTLAAGKLRVTNHDLVNQAGPEAEFLLRMHELGVEEPNVVVFSRGNLRSQHRLLGEIAEIDIGNPFAEQEAFVPPTMKAFHGQEVLILGLRKVSQQSAPKIYFSTGHEELDLYGDGDRDMGRLHSALVADGFDVAWWDPEEDGGVPDDCAALAIVGLSQPLSESAFRSARNYVLAGGRLMAGAHVGFDRDGSVTHLLDSLGLEVVPGVVSEPFVAPNGQLSMGRERVALIQADASEMLQHPITDPLRRVGRRVVFARCRSVVRQAKNLAPGGRVLSLVRSDDLAWIDTGEGDRKPNYRPDEWEKKGTQPLVAALTFSPTLPSKVEVSHRRESRVLAIGTADFFENRSNPYNQDFLVNGFNWLTGRELRVNVTTKDPDLRRLNLAETDALAVTSRVAMYILPGIFLMLGAVIFFMRKRA